MSLTILISFIAILSYITISHKIQEYKYDELLSKITQLQMQNKLTSLDTDYGLEYLRKIIDRLDEIKEMK